MSDEQPARRARAAAWLLTPPSWCCLAAGCVGLALAGPFALLLLPIAAPPLFLAYLQARYGTQVLRGHAAASRPLLVTAILTAVLLLAGAVVGLPGPTHAPPRLTEVPSGVLAGVLALAGAAAAHLLAVALLWQAARGTRTRRSAVHLVSLGLAALAVAQVVALTYPRASG